MSKSELVPVKGADYTNAVFNYLTGVRIVKRDMHGHAYRLYKCACGSDYVARANLVVFGAIVSCGCYNRSPTKNKEFPGGLALKRAAYKNHLSAAKKRSLVSHLTLDQYLEIGSKPCYYCGKYSTRYITKRKKSVQFNSIDRYNNEPYYDMTNSVPACKTCQKAKSNLPAEVFIEHCRSVSDYQIKKSSAGGASDT